MDRTLSRMEERIPRPPPPEEPPFPPLPPTTPGDEYSNGGSTQAEAAGDGNNTLCTTVTLCDGNREMWMIAKKLLNLWRQLFV